KRQRGADQLVPGSERRSIAGQPAQTFQQSQREDRLHAERLSRLQFSTRTLERLVRALQTTTRADRKFKCRRARDDRRRGFDGQPVLVWSGRSRGGAARSSG